MTRKDIKRGTIGTLLFSVAAYCAILAAAWHNGSCRRQAFAEVEAGPRVHWSDTLTNLSSQWDALSPLDADMARFMQKWELKGVSFAVTRNDSLLYAKGYGYADAEAGIPMDPGHIMRIASASKLVTAIAVMKLVEEGKLSLGSRVFGPGGILDDPEYESAMCEERMKEITIDHLLQHSAGFGRGAGDPMFTTNEIIKAKRLDTVPEKEQLVKIVLGRRMAFSPGAGRRYSNFGYLLLSMAIEKASGKSYWDYVAESVLEPAGITDFRPATNYYSGREAREVRYYGPDDEMVEEYNGSGRMVDRIYGGNDVHGLMGAGGWLASAAGLARLVAATDDDPRLKDILAPESVALLTEHGEEENLARGWSESDGKGRWVRTGTLSSTHTLIEHFPGGECWVMVTNTGVWTGHHFSRDMSRFIDRLRERYRHLMPARDLF